MTYFTKDDSKFYPRLFLEEAFLGPYGDSSFL